MKNLASVTLGLLLVPILFSQCSKEDDDNALFDTRFYTSSPSGAMSLYIDDVYKGELRYFGSAPACGSTTADAMKPLSMKLRSGEYRVTGKNAQGKIVSRSVVRLSTSTKGTSGNLGGIQLQDNGECVTIGLFE
jgi:hypothetical protein